MPVHNAEIAAAFDEMAELLELSGENPFRIRAYRRAAQVVRGLPNELYEQLKQGFDPDTLPGIGPDLAQKIREITGEGHCRALDKLRKAVPSGLRELLSLPGIGPQRARALYSALKIHDLAGLNTALAEGRLRKVRGFGVKTEQRLQQAIAHVSQGNKRVLRSVAAQYAVSLKDYLSKLPGVSEVDVAGSFRRGRETVGDLDFVVSAAVPININAALSRYDETQSMLAKGPTRASLLLRSGMQVDVRTVKPESYGAALYYFTGSKAHNIHVRKLALARGLKINEYGVFRDSKRVAGETEESVFASVGLPFIAPELREDAGEIEAAQAGRLPQLIERADLRGDLHAHTKRSDGTATLAEMAQAAKQAGLEYLAITDHSKYIGAVHGLDASAVSRQIDEIDAVNDALQGIQMLKGIEVDVLEDGELALPDAVLKRLDLVVIAVHGQFALNRRKQTDRLLRALDHPCVSILAHPTARLIDQRAPIDCDWSKVLRAVNQRHCYVELNSQPTRLDFNEALAREAAAEGILISIASDAHRTGDFAYLDAGVLQARRAWLTLQQVLNARSLVQVKKLLKSTFI